jgi:hypothetical protein
VKNILKRNKIQQKHYWHIDQHHYSKRILASRTPYGKKDKVNNTNNATTFNTTTATPETLQRKAYRSKQKKNFDNRHKAQPLKPLPPGATVYITDIWIVREQ